jgi:ACS family sodium-dependent inorganic phosphate cotransporter
MVASCFILNALLKTVINSAIVAMINKKNQTDANLFDWTESEKQNILGIFFWGFALTKIPSGRLAEVIGSRRVSGYSMMLASLLTLLTPILAYWNYYALLTSRVLMGFLLGASWPAIMPLAAKWVPPEEQSMFMTTLASSAIGISLASHISGILIPKFGWQSVFYITGSMSLFWSLIWFYLIYDSPQQHPRISHKEKQLLENTTRKNVNAHLKKKFGEIPWKEILTSKPVYAIVFAQISNFVATMIILTQLPSYLDQIFQYNMKQIGLFSGLPTWGKINTTGMYIFVYVI